MKMMKKNQITLWLFICFFCLIILSSCSNVKYSLYGPKGPSFKTKNEALLQYKNLMMSQIQAIPIETFPRFKSLLVIKPGKQFIQYNLIKTSGNIRRSEYGKGVSFEVALVSLDIDLLVEALRHSHMFESVEMIKASLHKNNIRDDNKLSKKFQLVMTFSKNGGLIINTTTKNGFYVKKGDDLPETIRNIRDFLKKDPANRLNR